MDKALFAQKMRDLYATHGPQAYRELPASIWDKWEVHPMYTCTKCRTIFTFEQMVAIAQVKLANQRGLQRLTWCKRCGSFKNIVPYIQEEHG